MPDTPSKLSPIDDGGPAYPLTIIKESDSKTGAPVNCDVFTGMSLRDHFARQALVKFSSFIDVRVPGTMKVVAELCYQMADALLTARKGGGERV